MTKGRRQLGIALALATAGACMKAALSPAPPPSHAIASEVMALLNAPTSAGPAPAFSFQSSLPTTFPGALIPGGAEIAAIATGGSRTFVVARIPRRVSFFWPHHEWRLQDGGWTLRGLPAAGFTSSSISVPPSTTLCRGTEFATLTYRTGTEGDRLVRIVSGSEPDRSCAPITTPFSDLPLPRFELPDSVRSRQGSGFAMRSDATSSRARLETSMSPQSLADLCVPQMVAAGWIVESGTTAERGLSVTRLRANTRTGDPVTAHLIFAVLEPEVSVLGLLFAARDLASSPTPRVAFPATPEEGADLAETARRLLTEGLGREDAAALTAQPTVPEGFPPELSFPGSEVVSVAASPTTTVVISRVAAGAPFDPARFEWSIEDRRWTSMAAIRFGFSPVPAAEPTFCRGNEFVSWTYRTLTTGERLLRASVTTAPQRRACAPPSTRALPDVAMPVLQLPAGVRRFGGGGSSGSTNDAASSSRLQTDIATETLLSAMVPQMRAVGWMEQERIAGLAATSIARLVTDSRKGQPVTALLVFTAMGPYVDALLIVTRNTPEPLDGR